MTRPEDYFAIEVQGVKNLTSLGIAVGERITTSGPVDHHSGGFELRSMFTEKVIDAGSASMLHLRLHDNETEFGPDDDLLLHPVTTLAVDVVNAAGVKEFSNWAIVCGCDGHGDHAACTKACNQWGCAHPVGINASGTKAESSRWSGKTLPPEIVIRAARAEIDRIEAKAAKKVARLERLIAKQENH